MSIIKKHVIKKLKGKNTVHDTYPMDNVKDKKLGIDIENNNDEKQSNMVDERPVLVNGEDIINVDQLDAHGKFPKEVYAIELLRNDIYLGKIDKDTNKEKVVIKIDRSGIDSVVITDNGKKILNSMITEANITELKKRDREIQAYLNKTADQDTDRLNLREMGVYLRWASGGVLAIIEYKNKKYIPLFYRDKKPFGWNLFLGSTERQFDEQEKLINNVIEEYTNPSLFILREFEEELLVFEKKPDQSKEMNKIIPISLNSRGNNLEKYYSKHITLRNRYDKLNITEHEDKIIETETVNTDMILKIGTRPFSNVLVCFNLMELGIEVVQILKFKIEDSNVLIDGELLNNEETELVRMPIALISCDFLEKHFKGDISGLGMTEGANSSFYINEPIPEEEMVLFNYDLKKRKEIVNGDNAKMKIGTKEIERYKNSFKEYFNIDDCTVKKDMSRYFTPAAAKMLNLMFQQVDEKEYKQPD